jgi:hypothetical protein
VPGGPNKRTPDLLFMPAQRVAQYLQYSKIEPRMELNSNLKKIALGVEAEAVQYPRYPFSLVQGHQRRSSSHLGSDRKTSTISGIAAINETGEK